jgi:biopolymer transport protein ExbD
VRHKVHRNKPNIPTASLGDIAFLLIIFFMVCSNFAKEASIELTPPQASDIKKVEEAKVSVSIDKNGKIYLQGNSVANAEALEWGILALLKNETSSDRRTVQFKCDNEVPNNVYEPALNAIAKAGGIIVATGEKNKRRIND